MIQDFHKKYGNKKRSTQEIWEQGMNTQLLCLYLHPLSNCLRSSQLDIFVLLLCVMRESPISFPYYLCTLLGMGGRDSGDFFAILQKKYSFCYLPIIVASFFGTRLS